MSAPADIAAREGANPIFPVTSGPLGDAGAVVTLPADNDMSGWVEVLADPLRAKRAFWHLVLSGPIALEPAKAGLGHPDPDVRRHCARILDHLADEDAYRDLAGALSDPDAGVRAAAMHALACDRCKSDACRPDKAMVLSHALERLAGDPDKFVRALSAEVVGRFVHTDPAAEVALVRARQTDPEPSVRKKAGWYAPGGTIFRKTQPRPARRGV